MNTPQVETPPDGAAAGARRPRLGFLGVGWIGKHRMEAIAASGEAEVAAVADSAPSVREVAMRSAPGAEAMETIGDLLAAELDGIVIATPSALHADQSIRALESGVAVFCQKPLGRTARETRRVVDAARAANRLLGVDLSYRRTAAMARIQEAIAAGEIGRVYASDLVFHNAYGPDKPWFRDPELSGGGCVIDLGTHLVDLALWVQGFPRITNVTGRLFRGGERVGPEDVEDFAVARLDFANGSTASIACSWNLNAGQDAVISATFYGTAGALRMANVGGSFYDFVAERLDGTQRTTLVEPPDDWGGRTAVEWARRLARDPSYDPEIEHCLDLAAALDAIYGREAR